MIEPACNSLHTDLHYWVMKLKEIGLKADKAVLWLATPNAAFNSRVPFDMIKEGRTEELNSLILQYKEKAFN